MSHLFKFSGRTTGAAFWLGHLVLMAYASTAGVGLFAGFVFGSFTLALGIGVLVWFVTAVCAAAVVAVLAAGICALVIPRAHDLGHSGWTALLLLVPGVNLILWLYLGLAPGKTVQNQYGPESQVRRLA